MTRTPTLAIPVGPYTPANSPSNQPVHWLPLANCVPLKPSSARAPLVPIPYHAMSSSVPWAFAGPYPTAQASPGGVIDLALQTPHASRTAPAPAQVKNQASFGSVGNALADALADALGASTSSTESLGRDEALENAKLLMRFAHTAVHSN